MVQFRAACVEEYEWTRIKVLQVYFIMRADRKACLLGHLNLVVAVAHLCEVRVARELKGGDRVAFIHPTNGSPPRRA